MSSTHVYPKQQLLGNRTLRFLLFKLEFFFFLTKGKSLVVARSYFNILKINLIEFVFSGRKSFYIFLLIHIVLF